MAGAGAEHHVAVECNLSIRATIKQQLQNLPMASHIIEHWRGAQLQNEVKEPHDILPSLEVKLRKDSEHPCRQISSQKTSKQLGLLRSCSLGLFKHADSCLQTGPHLFSWHGGLRR